MNIIMNIGHTIKELRQARGLTQMQLAEGINSTQASVQEWETGKKCPMIDAVVALAKFFDVSTDYLLGVENASGVEARCYPYDKN